MSFTKYTKTLERGSPDPFFVCMYLAYVWSTCMQKKSEVLFKRLPGYLVEEKKKWQNNIYGNNNKKV